MYLICGEALYDFFTRSGETDALADEAHDRTIHFAATAGGSPLNLAIGIRRLGAAVALCAGISTDRLGTRLLALLENERVQRDFIIRNQKPTPIVLAETDENGLPHYAFYGAGGADTAIMDADLRPDLSAISGIHFGSYATVVSPAADAFARLAAGAEDKFLAYDPNVRLTIEPDHEIWRARFNEYARRVDYIKLSTEDFAALFPQQSPAETVPQWLTNPRLQLVIVTDEWRAVRAWHRRGWQLQVQPVAAREMVDSVGAGDSFQAAMLAQFNAHDKRRQLAELDASGLRAMLYFASRCAAYTCAQRGANLPRMAEIMEPGSPD